MTDECIKIYNGGEPKIAEAIYVLEEFIGDIEHAELTDGSTVYAPEAVAALNVLIDRLNRLAAQQRS